MLSQNVQSFNRLMSVLVQSDHTYADLPPDLLIAVEQLTKAMPEDGPRQTLRWGSGLNPGGPEKFNQEKHNPRRIKALLSARVGEDMVIESEQEQRQHVYLWRMSGPWMDYPKGVTERKTKQFCADAMMLALGRYVSGAGDHVSVLGGPQTRITSASTPSILAHIESMIDENGVTAFSPRRMPRNSIAVLFLDILITPLDELECDLRQLSNMGLTGHVVAVQDTDELTFPITGNRKFIGLRGEGVVEFKKAETRRAAYLKKVDERLQRAQTICSNHRFNFILQSTDQPLHKGLMPIFDTGMQSSYNAPEVSP